MNFHEQRSVKRTTETFSIEYVDVKCDNCEKPLEHVLPESARSFGSSLQMEDALEIRIGEGGYGMYIDTGFISDHCDLLFCKECGDSLVEQFPGIAKAVEYLNGQNGF